ncbi:hypothetical protein B1810_11065 [Panacagrimonas perspica]|nr:hypothetical protein B1810_11065 [Panacagrimonas perspica]
MRIAAGILAAVLCPTAMAYETGDWITRLGAHWVEPKNHNHDVVGVEGTGGITASASYFVAPTLAVDLLVAFPFEHDITLNSTDDKVASTQHLPPTLSLVWYPDVAKTWHPFVGAGLNYTTFFQEKTQGALDGAKLKLDDSFGVAAVAGLDIDIAPPLSLSFDVRYIDIDAKAHLDGTSIGKVKIDPIGFGISVGYRF